MDFKQLYIYGAGGHAKVVAELAEILNYEIVCFFETPFCKDMLWNYPVTDDFIQKNGYSIVAIGNNKVRKEVVDQAPRRYVTLAHVNANISRRSSLAEGTVVMAGVSVNSDVMIGKHCIINTNASVDHDCNIEDYVHLSPNVALAGNVVVGEGTHVGIGACIIQGVKIGKWCTIGAGTVVLRDVPDGVTVVGNPGRSIKK